MTIGSFDYWRPSCTAAPCSASGSRAICTSVLKRHRLNEQRYSLGQLRCDPGNLRAHGLAERLGTSRRYRVSGEGVRRGALLVKVRTRLLGPIFAGRHRAGRWPQRQPSVVEGALRSVDQALDAVCESAARRRLSRRPNFVTQTTFSTPDTYATRVNGIVRTSRLGSYRHGPIPMYNTRRERCGSFRMRAGPSGLLRTSHCQPKGLAAPSDGTTRGSRTLGERRTRWPG